MFFKLEIYIKIVSSLFIDNYIDVDPLNVSARLATVLEPYFYPLKEADIMIPSRDGPLPSWSPRRVTLPVSHPTLLEDRKLSWCCFAI